MASKIEFTGPSTDADTINNYNASIGKKKNLKNLASNAAKTCSLQNNNKHDDKPKNYSKFKSLELDYKFFDPTKVPKTTKVA